MFIWTLAFLACVLARSPGLDHRLENLKSSSGTELNALHRVSEATNTHGQSRSISSSDANEETKLRMLRVLQRPSALTRRKLPPVPVNPVDVFVCTWESGFPGTTYFQHIMYFLKYAWCILKRMIPVFR